MAKNRAFLIALLVMSPALAQAQFTTFIPPRNKVADSVKAAVVAEQKAQADTSAATRLTNMKTWVDSAAGVIPPLTAADSLAAGIAPDTTFEMDTLTMRNGARAPSTASALPLAALAGVLAVSLGLALARRKRPAPAKARSRRRRA